MGETQSKPSSTSITDFGVSKQVKGNSIIHQMGDFKIIKKSIPNKQIVLQYKEEICSIQHKIKPEFNDNLSTSSNSPGNFIEELNDEGGIFDLSYLEENLASELQIDQSDSIVKLKLIRNSLMSKILSIFQTIQYQTEIAYTGDVFSLSLSSTVTEDKMRIFKSYTTFSLNCTSDVLLKIMNDTQFQKNTDKKIESYRNSHEYNEDFHIFNLVYKKVFLQLI